MQKLLKYLRNSWWLIAVALASSIAYHYATKAFPVFAKTFWVAIICYLATGIFLVISEILAPKEIALAKARRGIERASQHIEERSELEALRAAIASHWGEMHDKEALLTYNINGDLRGLSAPRPIFGEAQEIRLDNHYRYCTTTGIREKILCLFMPKTRMLLAPGLSIKIALATFAKMQDAATQ